MDFILGYHTAIEVKANTLGESQILLEPPLRTRHASRTSNKEFLVVGGKPASNELPGWQPDREQDRQLGMSRSTYRQCQNVKALST